MKGSGKHDDLPCIEATRLVVTQAQPEDVTDILCWRNDPLVRAMSRCHEPISELAHGAWYSRAVKDKNRLLLIGIYDGQKIGMVRFDYSPDTLWEVSIMLAAEARGQGLARHFLRMGLDRLHLARGPVSVLAVARLNNEPSIRLFHALGFSRESDDGEFVRLLYHAKYQCPESEIR